MLTILQKYAVNLYKAYILHPRMDCTKDIINQHYSWPRFRDDIRTHVKVCKTCQKTRYKIPNMEIYPQN